MDYFFRDNVDIKKILNNKWNFEGYQKVIFWMPTYRKSISSHLSEEYFDSETGLPIFYNKNSLNTFSKHLKENNILLVFKLHHLQADLPIFHTEYSNILMINDQTLQSIDVQLYQLVTFADAMITDYSSIAIDYLLLDRPIIFTLDDYEQYDKSRGLFPKNAIDYMPGYHVYNDTELKDAIEDIRQGIDKYKNTRASIIDKYHTYKDGNSSQRIVELLGLI